MLLLICSCIIMHAELAPPCHCVHQYTIPFPIKDGRAHVEVRSILLFELILPLLQMGSALLPVGIQMLFSRSLPHAVAGYAAEHTGALWPLSPASHKQYTIYITFFFMMSSDNGCGASFIYSFLFYDVVFVVCCVGHVQGRLPW